MSKEGQAIGKMQVPNTIDSLKRDLQTLGIKSGDEVIVHSSLSAIGWVSGGAVAVIQALMETVTEEGTIVMPTQSGDLSDPSLWQEPPVPKEWWDTIRNTMPAYNPQITPTRGMGKIVEVFRTFPNVKRSNHPQVSFAAWGRNSKDWMGDHSLDYGLGENSPLRKLYDHNTRVLLIGVGYDSNTAFHLAEYRLPNTKVDKSYAPIMLNGKRVWHTIKDVSHYEDWFEEMGEAFEKQGSVTLGKIGAAEVKIFSVKESVDFAIEWLTEKRENTLM